METMQNSDEPEALANTVKHFAFTRCVELNVFGIRLAFTELAAPLSCDGPIVLGIDARITGITMILSSFVEIQSMVRGIQY